jgi:predicted  nucleic acid-binding Zn-ribbon protein
MSTIKISELPKIDKISKEGMIPISDKDVQDILNTYHITLEDFTKSFSNTTWGSSLDADLSDIKGKMTEFEEDFEQVELNRTNISALAQNVEDQSEQISAVNGNIDLLTGKITKNTTDISDLYTKNTEVNTKLQNIEKYDFDDLIQKITDNTSNIGANTSSITTIEASVNTILLIFQITHLLFLLYKQRLKQMQMIFQRLKQTFKQ